MVWSRQDEPAAMTSRKGVRGSGGSKGAACPPPLPPSRSSVTTPLDPDPATPLSPLSHFSSLFYRVFWTDLSTHPFPSSLDQPSVVHIFLSFLYDFLDHPSDPPFSTPPILID